MDDCWIELAEQGPQASCVLADRQSHRHASDKKPADLAEPSLVPKPGVSEGRQRLREWQHVNGHPERLGLRDERTVARHDEMPLDARDRLGDTRHEIEKTQLRATDLADRIEVDNSHFKPPRSGTPAGSWDVARPPFGRPEVSVSAEVGTVRRGSSGPPWLSGGLRVSRRSGAARPVQRTCCRKPLLIIYRQLSSARLRFIGVTVHVGRLRTHHLNGR